MSSNEAGLRFEPPATPSKYGAAEVVDDVVTFVVAAVATVLVVDVGVVLVTGVGATFVTVLVVVVPQDATTSEAATARRS